MSTVKAILGVFTAMASGIIIGMLFNTKKRTRDISARKASKVVERAYERARDQR